MRWAKAMHSQSGTLLLMLIPTTATTYHHLFKVGQLSNEGLRAAAGMAGNPQHPTIGRGDCAHTCGAQEMSPCMPLQPERGAGSPPASPWRTSAPGR